MYPMEHTRYCTMCMSKGIRVEALFIASDIHGLKWFECNEHGPTDNVAGVYRIHQIPVNQLQFCIDRDELKESVGTLLKPGVEEDEAKKIIAGALSTLVKSKGHKEIASIVLYFVALGEDPDSPEYDLAHEYFMVIDAGVLEMGKTMGKAVIAIEEAARLSNIPIGRKEDS